MNFVGSPVSRQKRLNWQHCNADIIPGLIEPAGPDAPWLRAGSWTSEFGDVATMADSVIESFLASRRADFSEFSNLLQLSRPSIIGALRGRRG